MPDIQLSDEIKARLKQAGAVAYQLKNTWKYVPRAYREMDKDGEDYLIPKGLWPVFTLRCIDGVSASKMEDKISTRVEYNDNGTRSIILNSGRARLGTCALGIVGVKNFKDESGKEVKLKRDEVTGGVTEDSLKHIHPKLQTELTNVITEQENLTDDELSGLE